MKVLQYPSDSSASQSSPTQFPNTAAAIEKLRGEIQRTENSRYLHRVHAVLLVLRGMSCPAAAAVLHQPARTIAGWVARFRRLGLVGLEDRAPSGRPPRLTDEQLAQIRERLSDPHAQIFPANGRALSEWLDREFHVHLEIRQCQRLIKRLLPSGSSRGNAF